MNQKIIKIDLSKFFDDERKFCCVLVDANWKSVACLQKRVQLLFDIDYVRFLSDGCFLPPQESIEIVKLCKDIKAFAPKEALLLRKDKKGQKNKNIEKSSEDSVNECDREHVHNLQKKRKSNFIENCHSPSSFSNKAKRLKNNKKNAISKSLEVPDREHKSLKLKEFTIENQSAKPNENNEYSTKDNTVVPRGSDDEHKKCQTPMPKEIKKSENAESNADKTFNDIMKTKTARHSNILSSTFLNESNILENSGNCSNAKNPFKEPNCSRAHIYFNETGEIASPTIRTESKSRQKKIKEPKTIVFRCPLSDVTNSTQIKKVRIFHLKSINTSMINNKSKKERVEIQEQVVLPPLSIQNITNELSLANEEAEANEVVKQKEINDSTKKTDNVQSVNENSSINNAAAAMGTSVNNKNDGEEQGIITDVKYANVTQTHSESQLNQTNVGETSIMSVDCVDLSIDLDEDDVGVQKKTATETQEEKYDVTTNDESRKSSLSDIEEISEIIDLNETEDNCNTMVNNLTPQNNSLKDIRVDKILPFSTDLTVLPNTEDIIIFKVPYLNKKKEFVNTNFIAGRVEYINRRTNRIKILILDGTSELCCIPNQFLCNLDESQDFDKYLQLKLDDMREPKLFSNS